MQLLVRTLAAASLTVGLGGAVAQARTLVAGPLPVGSNEALLCQITNVGSRPLALRIEALDSSGRGVRSYQSTGDGAEPFTTTSVPALDPNSTLCRFTFSGSANSVRAAAIIRDRIGGETRAVVPAQ